MEEWNIAKQIILPNFLIEIETFNELKDPPTKNFNYKEIFYSYDQIADFDDELSNINVM